MDTLELTFAKDILRLLGGDAGLKHLGIVNYRVRPNSITLLCGPPTMLKFTIFKRIGRGWAIVVETNDQIPTNQMEAEDFATIKRLIVGTLKKDSG